jgi:hypothetical protein
LVVDIFTLYVGGAVAVASAGAGIDGLAAVVSARAAGASGRSNRRSVVISERVGLMQRR